MMIPVIPLTEPSNSNSFLIFLSNRHQQVLFSFSLLGKGENIQDCLNQISCYSLAHRTLNTHFLLASFVDSVSM